MTVRSRDVSAVLAEFRRAHRDGVRVSVDGLPVRVGDLVGTADWVTVGTVLEQRRDGWLLGFDDGTVETFRVSAVGWVNLTVRAEWQGRVAA